MSGEMKPSPTGGLACGAWDASARRAERGFVHILLIVLITFGITVYGFLPSLEEALTAENRVERKRLHGLNDTRRVLANFALRGPELSGADQSEEGGAGLRRYLLPCPDLPDSATNEPDGVSEQSCQSEPSSFGGTDLLADGWLTTPLVDLQTVSARAGFLPEQGRNPHHPDRTADLVGFEAGNDATRRPLYMVSRNVVREDRPLNPTSLVRLPKREWLSLEVESAAASAVGGTVMATVAAYDLGARIAALMVAPGEENNPCTTATPPSRNAAAGLITDWTELFQRTGGVCEYPPRIRESHNGSDLGPTSDRVSFLTVEELVSGGSGNLEELEDSVPGWEETISGSRGGLSLVEALEGYYRRHGHFPDPAGFDVGTGTSDDDYLHDDASQTELPLAGLPHHASLLRTGGLDTQVDFSTAGGTAVTATMELLHHAGRSGPVETVLAPRTRRVRVHLPRDIQVDSDDVDAANLRPPFSPYPLDPASHVEVSTNRAYARVRAVLPQESAYRSAEELGLRPRLPDILRSTGTGLLAEQVRAADALDYGTGPEFGALRAYRSHMETVVPAGVQLFAAPGDATLHVPAENIGLETQTVVVTSVVPTTVPDQYMEVTFDYEIPGGDATVVSARDGMVHEYELEAGLMALGSTPTTDALREELPLRAPLRPSNKGFLPVGSLLGDLPSQLDPNRVVPGPQVSLNLVCQDGLTLSVALDSVHGSCPAGAEAVIPASLTVDLAGLTDPEVPALRLLLPAAMEFLVLPKGAYGVMVESFPYLVSGASRNVAAFRLENPRPFRVPEVDTEFLDTLRSGTSYPQLLLGGFGLGSAAEVKPVRLRLPAGTQLVVNLSAGQSFAVGKDFAFPQMYAVVPAGTRVPGALDPGSVRPSGRGVVSPTVVIEDVLLPRGGIVHFNNGPGENRVLLSPSNHASYSEVATDRQRRNLRFEVMGDGVKIWDGTTAHEVGAGCFVLPYRPAWYCGHESYVLETAGHELRTAGNSVMELRVRAVDHYTRRLGNNGATGADFAWGYGSANALGYVSHSSLLSDVNVVLGDGTVATLEVPQLLADESTRVLAPAGATLAIAGAGAAVAVLPDSTSEAAPALLNDFLPLYDGYVLYAGDGTSGASTMYGANYFADSDEERLETVATEVTLTNAVVQDLSVSPPGTLTTYAQLDGTVHLPPGFPLTLANAFTLGYSAVAQSDMALTGNASDGAGGTVEVATVVPAGTVLDIDATGASQRVVRVRGRHGGGTVRSGRLKLRPHYEMVGVLREAVTVLIDQPFLLDRYDFHAQTGGVTAFRGAQVQGVSLMQSVNVTTNATMTVLDPPDNFRFESNLLPVVGTSTLTVSVVAVDVDPDPLVDDFVTLALEPQYAGVGGQDTTYVFPAGTRVLLPGRTDYDYGAGVLRTDRVAFLPYRVFAGLATQATFSLYDFRSARLLSRELGLPARVQWGDVEVDTYPPLILTLGALDMFAPSGGALYREVAESVVTGIPAATGTITNVVGEIPAGAWLDIAAGEREWRGTQPGLLVESLPTALATLARDYPMVYAVAEECRRGAQPYVRDLTDECASGPGEGLVMDVEPESWVTVPRDMDVATRMMLVRPAPVAGGPRLTLRTPLFNGDGSISAVQTDTGLPWVLVDMQARTAVGGTVSLDFSSAQLVYTEVVSPPEGLEVIYLHDDEDLTDISGRIARGQQTGAAFANYAFPDAVRAHVRANLTLYPGGQYQRLDGELVGGHALLTVTPSETLELGPAVLYSDGEFNAAGLLESGAWRQDMDLTGFRPRAGQSYQLSLDLGDQPAHGHDHLSLPVATTTAMDFSSDPAVYLSLEQDYVMRQGYSWTGVIGSPATVTFAEMEQDPLPLELSDNRYEGSHWNRTSLFIRSYPDVDNIGGVTVTVTEVGGGTSQQVLSTSSLHQVMLYGVQTPPAPLPLEFQAAAVEVTFHLSFPVQVTVPATGAAFQFDEHGEGPVVSATRRYVANSGVSTPPPATQVTVTMPGTLVRGSGARVTVVEDNSATDGYVDEFVYEHRPAYGMSLWAEQRPKSSSLPSFARADLTVLLEDMNTVVTLAAGSLAGAELGGERFLPRLHGQADGSQPSFGVRDGRYYRGVRSQYEDSSGNLVVQTFAVAYGDGDGFFGAAPAGNALRGRNTVTVSAGSYEVLMTPQSGVTPTTNMFQDWSLPHTAPQLSSGVELGAGAVFSMNRANRMATTLQFGENFRIDGYAAIWPRYDTDTQQGWTFPAPPTGFGRGQQLYFERLSAVFEGGPPDDIWLVFPEPAGEMLTRDGELVRVYAGSLINPVTGEVRLARPFPADMSMILTMGASAALEGNFADAPRPLVVEPADSGVFSDPHELTGIGEAALTVLSGGDLCFTDNSIPPHPTNPQCEYSYGDLEVSLPATLFGSAFLTGTVAWDTTGAEAWLHADPGSPDSVENARVGSPVRTAGELLQRVRGRFLQPLRNVSEIRMPAGAFVMPRFRQQPRELGFVFPSGTEAQVAIPAAGSTQASVRTEVIDLGGRGVPGRVRTAPESFGVQVSVSLQMDELRSAYGSNVSSLWGSSALAAQVVSGVRVLRFPYSVSQASAPRNMTLRFSPIESTMLVSLKVPTSVARRGLDRFLDVDIAQNLWITLEEDVDVRWTPPGGGAQQTLRLERGTVLNPITGTYLPARNSPRAGQGVAERLETRGRSRLSFLGRSVELTRAGLTLPRGARFYAARGALLSNVQAAVFFSPYPLEATAGCANVSVADATAAGAYEDSGFRLNQLLEGVSVGGASRTYDPVSTGHICAYLDTRSNTDFDDMFTYRSGARRPRGAADARIEVNDRVYPVGGRLLGVFPGSQP